MREQPPKKIIPEESKPFVWEGVSFTAEEFINDYEKNGAPMGDVVTNNLKRIALENDVEVTSKTKASDIFIRLKQNKEAFKSSIATESELPPLTKPEDLVLESDVYEPKEENYSKTADGLLLETTSQQNRDIEDIMAEATFAEAGKVEEGPLPDLPPIESEEEKSSEENITGEVREINPELLLAAADKQGEKIDAEVKEKSNWVREKVVKTADWYKKQALWKKVLFSAGCIGAASASAAVGGTVGISIATAAFAGKLGQRMLGGMATFVTTEALLKSRYEKATGEERTKFATTRHTIEAATLGILVGSGEAVKVIKELSDVTGFTDILKTSYDYWIPKGESASVVPLIDHTGEQVKKAAIALAEQKKLEHIGELATIKKGEGIWHTVYRQLEEKIQNNPNAYGLKPEDLANEEKIKVIANKETGKLLTEQGYLKPDGTETRISHAGTKVLLGADNKINIEGAGSNLTYEVKIAEEMPKFKPAYMVNIDEIDEKGNIIPKIVEISENFQNKDSEFINNNIENINNTDTESEAVSESSDKSREVSQQGVNEQIADRIVETTDSETWNGRFMDESAETAETIPVIEKNEILNKVISSETRYPNMNERVNDFIKQIGDKKITAEEFIKYYENKTKSFVSNESVVALKENFKLIKNGTAQQKLMARRAFEIILKKLNPNLAKSLIS